jgi:ketosteroid isomerase-like protein
MSIVYSAVTVKIIIMSYYDKAKDIYEMSAQGKMMEAFEKYYHNDIVMVEATGESRKGKDTNRKFEQEFMGMIKEFHGGGVTAITSNEKEATTMVESWMDVTLTDGKRNKMEEVAVQKWKGDQIIHERFYYNVGK